MLADLGAQAGVGVGVARRTAWGGSARREATRAPGVTTSTSRPSPCRAVVNGARASGRGPGGATINTRTASGGAVGGRSGRGVRLLWRELAHRSWLPGARHAGPARLDLLMRFASVLIVAALAVAAFASTRPAPPRAALQLHLDGVKLLYMQRDPPSVGIGCDVRWVNGTGKPLVGSTCCSGAFDGLSLVAIDREGKEVVRQSYLAHQSPFAQALPVTLPTGETRETLTFPIDGVAFGSMSRFRIEGGLIGNEDHGSGYATEWQVATVFR